MLSYAFTLSLFLISSINTINTLDLKSIYGVDFWLPLVSAVFSPHNSPPCPTREQ